MPPADPFSDLLAIIARHWGFQGLRPLQEQAMRAVLARRDSLLVLPTGGGKSLCYQAPAVHRGKTTVVISPLIALMKDQVDGLRGNGVAAAQLDSTLTSAERRQVEAALEAGKLRLLFISPERLVGTDLYKTLQRIGVDTFAIDEAHCISHWGHDFRPEYRQLDRLRDLFPNASLHAYTATATEQVRRDIVRQLGLHDPLVMVGNFDRPNLVYRVLPRGSRTDQVLEVVGRHEGEAGIIYCISKKEVDQLTAQLQKRGLRASAYHADKSAEERRKVSEDFRAERCDVIVATVAFGMGVDRSNVRYVLHTGLPKSLEHYQQEAGRAGRDGLEAECVLLYSGRDPIVWRAMLENPRDAEAPPDPEHLAVCLAHLAEMDRYARGAVCRHRALVEHFGQEWTATREVAAPPDAKPTSRPLPSVGFAAGGCNACDLCLGETELVHEATVVAQKVLSCVARVKEAFGIGHVIEVLRGQQTERIRQRKHHELTTFGLLKQHRPAELRDWIYQLIDQDVLVQTDGEYPILQLNDASWEVMRSQREVRLVQVRAGKKGERAAAPTAEASWEGVDRALFDVLRNVRRELASARQVSAYLVFSDNTLRELARVRPSTPERMRQISGVGDHKLREFASHFLPVISDYCAKHDLPLDVSGTAPAAPSPPPAPKLTDRSESMFALFREGLTIEQVMEQTARARSTVVEYLGQYILSEQPTSIARWVDDEMYQRVVAAARQAGSIDRLKPVYLALGEKVSYDVIRLVLAHLRVAGTE